MSRWLKLLGAIVCIAAAAFFVAYAYRALHGQDLSALARPRVALSIGLLVLLYMTLIPVTAAAWTLILRGLGQRTSIAATAPILATSQFGKYLPGNIAHHVGRLVMARPVGIGLGIGAISLAYESILTVLACAHVSTLTFLWDAPKALEATLVPDDRGLLVALVTAAAIVSLAAVPWLSRAFWRFRNKDSTTPPPSLNPGPIPLLSGYLCFVLNFVLIGFGLWFVALALDAGGGSHPVLLTGAFAASWLIGFITPGAPAGLGVREAVLVFWLTDSMPPAAVVALVLALRIATTLGDLLSLAWGSAVMRRRRAGRLGAASPR